MSQRIKQTQITWHNPRLLFVFPPEPAPAVLKTTDPPIHHYRDGDVVLYRRPDSLTWQCRLKLLNGQWQRLSTRQRNLVDAARLACDRYDEIRFRQRNGLAPVARRFRDAAEATLCELRAERAAGTGKRIYADYCTAIERYLLPFFGDRYFDRIDHQVVAEFEQWRNQQMGRAPAHSTLLTYAAAWKRVQQTALQRGWLTAATSIPSLSVRGRRSQARPGFTAEEVTQLRTFMQSWVQEPTRRPVEGELRVLLCDYVELLLLTGMRHGTEAMRVEWQHWEWHTDRTGTRFLRLRVNGKTGARWLIAKHEVAGVLERMARRDVDCGGGALDQVLSAKLPVRLFRYSTGQQPYEFNTVFRRLLTSSGLLRDSQGPTRTLYSLRHTYATAELLAGTDIHTLAKQMGTSVVMLERHYSKLTATLAAGKLAG